MSKQLIIVEGNECTGKTTLVEELRGTLDFQGWDTKSLAHRPGNQFQRYLQEYVSADRIIFNRAHYAELVYSRLYRNGNPFTRQEIEALETTIEQKGLVIYCSLPVELIKARLSERNHREVLKPEPTSLEELEHMGLEFDDVFRNKAVIRYSAVVPDDLTSLLLKVKKWVLSDV